MKMSSTAFLGDCTDYPKALAKITSAASSKMCSLDATKPPTVS